MAFTREDYDDLIKMVLESPELSERMRFALFGQAFSALPADVQAIRITLSEVVATQRESAAQIKMLAEAQKRTEEQVAKLSEEVRTLTEAQKRTDQKIAELIKAQKHLEEQVAKLTEEMRVIVRRLDALTDSHYKLESRVNRLTGMVLEINYERKAQARFGRLLRKARVVEWNVLEDLLAGLSPEETEELSEIDLVVQGIWRQNPQYQVFLAIEISGKIEAWDVKRALERTKLMRKAGLLTLPVVAGEEITHEAKSHAKEQGVIVIMDGSMKFIEEALHRHPLSP